jgi:hypothetical protein
MARTRADDRNHHLHLENIIILNNFPVHYKKRKNFFFKFLFLFLTFCRIEKIIIKIIITRRQQQRLQRHDKRERERK